MSCPSISWQDDKTVFCCCSKAVSYRRSHIAVARLGPTRTCRNAACRLRTPSRSRRFPVSGPATAKHLRQDRWQGTGRRIFPRVACRILRCRGTLYNLSCGPAVPTRVEKLNHQINDLYTCFPYCPPRADTLCLLRIGGGLLDSGRTSWTFSSRRPPNWTTHRRYHGARKPQQHDSDRPCRVYTLSATIRNFEAVHMPNRTRYRTRRFSVD